MSSQKKTFKRSSFADKLKAGWTKEQLMKYYVLTEQEYGRILDSLETMGKR